MRKADIYLEGRLIKRIRFDEVRDEDERTVFVKKIDACEAPTLVALVPKNHLIIIVD